jgi:hypothetical protein
MSGMITAVAVSAAVGAYSSSQATKASNRASEQNARLTREEAKRRYALESGIAQQQMSEQQNLAMEKMTDISRAFLLASSQDKVIQAETGVGGNVQQRMEAINRTKASEAKGQVAKELDTNVINIANGMLANKIDTEAILAKAQAEKRSVALAALNGAISGASTGMQIGGAFRSASTTMGSVSSDVLAQASSKYNTYYGSQQNRMLAAQNAGF